MELLTTAYINLKAISKRFKWAIFLKVAGFTAAFTAFLIIMMQLHFEYTYESVHPNHANIYLVEDVSPEGITTILPRPYIDAVINSSPSIIAGTIITPYTSDAHLILEGDTELNVHTIDYTECFPAITEIFNFEIIEGDSKCLQNPNHVLIPESFAKKIFQDEPAIGKRLNTPSGEGYVEIGGVYKDFPANTQLHNNMYIPFGEYGKDNWTNHNYLAYIRINENTSPEDIIQNFNRTFTRAGHEGNSLNLIPIQDIYYSRNLNELKNGNKTTANVLLVIALLVIGIAAINYVNFNTSIIPMRIKSINTQKILGAGNFVLRKALVLETLIICIVSYLFALLIIHILKKIHYINFIEADISFYKHIPVLLIGGGITILVGIISGLYPAYYILKFPPAMVVKGAHGVSPTGKKLRTILVGFQFTISIILIIVSFFIHIQNNFVRNYNVGYNTEQIAIVDPGSSCLSQRDAYVNKLKENPAIEDVAFSMFRFGATDIYMQWGGVLYQGNEFGSTILPISWNFLDLMDIQYEGERLSINHEANPNGYMLPNQKLKNEFHMQANTKLEVPWRTEHGYEVLGFTDNVNPRSLKHSLSNVCFMIGGNNYNYNSYIKIKSGSNVHEAVAHIQKTIEDIDPLWPFEIEFFNTIYDNIYKKEANLSKIIFLFSLLAGIISILGVFALIIFETQYRYKEIGIRKVYGADIKSILWSFNRYYLFIAVICSVIGAPFAWHIVNEWLKEFAYKTPQHWWVYIIAFCIIATITLFTVTLQSWRTANQNPAESLKTE